MSERSLFAPPLYTSGTELIDALFLELSQFTKARSRRERIMIRALTKIIENVDPTALAVDAQTIASQALKDINS